MADYALIVGVEAYETPYAPPLQAPALDALKFARWLRKQGVPASNISLLYNRCDQWAGELLKKLNEEAQAAEQEGIVHAGAPSYELVTDIWRKQLAACKEPKSTLWVYWSGHGVTFPDDREALLCTDLRYDDPSFIYLSELRASLRSERYCCFDRQRLFIDACADYQSYQALKIQSVRNPDTFSPAHSPEQIELNAVAIGETARAEQGGSLFSRVLLETLQADPGWAKTLKAFDERLRQALTEAQPSRAKQPRISVRSPHHESSEDADPRCRLILELLTACKVSFERYGPLYVRTIGTIAADPKAQNATSLSARIKHLVGLENEAIFGGHSKALVEFLLRVTREFPQETGAVADWLNKHIPQGGLETIAAALNREGSDLVLAMRVVESASNKDGFPATLTGWLADESFSNTLQSWTLQGLKDQAAVETEIRAILREAGALARAQDVQLAVHVFANPPLLCVPYHAVRIDPDDKEDFRAFGQFHPFYLRSRARLDRNDEKYDLESWREKAAALRKTEQCEEIVFHPAPPWSLQAGDELAEVEGLLVMREALEPVTEGATNPHKVLSAALKRGLPLVSWRTRPPANDDWADYEKRIKSILERCKSIGQSPLHLKNERKSKDWARETALLWDDDDTQALRTLIQEEPFSQ